MRRVVGAEMGVKAAGGVRDYDGLKAMVAAGATRVGASAGVKIVQESEGKKPSASAPAGLLIRQLEGDRYRHHDIHGAAVQQRRGEAPLTHGVHRRDREVGVDLRA
jgi:hypothetical protein